ncbi:MAG: FKBP-type peptidyl-prolyl cis-trans isomerase [Bacteroidales bacterium]|nr:FKBP-type peptidyl-prolyl cis-trans isomerase [Bacteroidales bacterium]
MTKEQKISYAIGANLGTQVSHDGIELNLDALVQGLRDAMAGQNKFSDEQMQEAFMMLQQDMQAKQQEMQAKRDEVANEEKIKGKMFLEENKKNPDVKVTPSGLQYKVITMGTGEKPAATNTVTVKYKGTLLDGTVFDSTEKQGGEPIQFPLNGVIPGWTEGVQLMPTGSKFIFYIPSDLAYGDRGAGPQIPGGATLIFEIELISFK